MTELELYQGINECSSLSQLARFLLKIESIESRNPLIGNKSGKYWAEMMYKAVETYEWSYLTRNYGLRQQVMMILHYNPSLGGSKLL